jgi:hypothetical protein
MNKEDKKELQKLLDEITEEAKNIVEDYSKNPSEISGSTVQVNENSPYLDDTFKGKSWKKVIKGGVDEALSEISKKGLGKKKKK